MNLRLDTSFKNFSKREKGTNICFSALLKEEEGAGMKMPKILAHRGASAYAPENTMEAILNIEVKQVYSKSYTCYKLGLLAAKIVEDYHLLENVIFSSFHHMAMVKLKDSYPNIQIGLLYNVVLYHAGNYAMVAKADAIHPNYKSINTSMIKEAHKHSIKVNTWTVNDSLQAIELNKMGVDSIITNCPDICRRELRSY